MGTWVPDNAIADFLDTVIIDMKFLFIDFWSIVHLFSGGLLAYIFTFIPYEIFDKYGWFIALILFIIYEIAEIALRGRVFDFETNVNIVWDIIFAMTTFVSVKYFIL